MKQNLYGKNAAQMLSLRFQAQHPVVALLYYCEMFAALFLFDSLFYTAVILIWMMPLACRTAGIQKTLRLLGGAVLLGGLLLLLNPLLNSDGIHILFYLGERPVTMESLLYGAHNLLLIAALLMVFPSLNVLLDSERILFLFSRLMQTSALILSMSMRFVPLLTRRARELRQLHRGWRRPACTIEPCREVARRAAGLDDGGGHAILPNTPGAWIRRAEPKLLWSIPLYRPRCRSKLLVVDKLGLDDWPAHPWRGEMALFSRL